MDCGLENLLVCLFLGMTARGPAPVLAVSHRFSRRDTEQQAWFSSLAGSRDKSGESEAERLGERSECNRRRGEGCGRSKLVLVQSCKKADETSRYKDNKSLGGYWQGRSESNPGVYQLGSRPMYTM